MIDYLRAYYHEVCLRRSYLLPLRIAMQKECSRCNTIKPMTSFKIDKRRPDSRTVTCKYCYINNKVGRGFKTQEQIARQAEKLRGRKHSIEWRMAISRGHLKASQEGRNHFKKNAPSDPDNFRMRLEYQLWRDEVIKIKGNLCELCSSDKRIHVHHIKCFYKFPELKTDVNNGQVLCQSCHMKLTWEEKRKSGSRVHVNCKCPQHQNKGDC